MVNNTTTYTVPPNNWTSEVNRVIANDLKNGLNVVQYPVGFGAQSDPAPECSKMFTSTYKCGSDSKEVKTITVDAEAYGKFAVFDCSDEAMRCLNNRVFLTDEGNIISSAQDGKIIWQSGVINELHEATIVSEFKGGNTPLNRSYLMQGETLAPGQLLGSPSGKCALRINPENPKQLQIVFKTANKSSIDGKVVGGTGSPPNMGVYRVATAGTAGLGKMGHISMEGEMREYPSSMMKTSDVYTDVGKYTTDGNKLNEYYGFSTQDCKIMCNGMEACQSVEIQPGALCTLKGAGSYPDGKRTPSSTTQLYVRDRKPVYPKTCDGDPVIMPPSTWDLYPKGKPMTNESTCGFAAISKTEMNELSTLRTELDTLLKEIKDKITEINSHDSVITKDILSTREQLAHDIAEYQTIHDKYAKAKKDSTAFAGQMQSTMYQSTVEHSYFVMWGTIAALATLGAAYFFKKKTSSM